jgi:hypothetical protein
MYVPTAGCVNMVALNRHTTTTVSGLREIV